MKKIAILALALVLTLAMAVPVMADEVPVKGYVCQSTVGCSIDAPASIDFGKLEAGTCCMAPAGSDEIIVTNTSKWEPAGKDCGPLPTVTLTFSVKDTAPDDSTLFYDHLSYACHGDCTYANAFWDDDPLDICMNLAGTGPGSVKYSYIGLNLKGVTPTAGVVYSGTLTITCN